MDYGKREDTDAGIVIVKEEFNLEFEELEFEGYGPEEFGDKVIEIFGLRNVPPETNGPKVPMCQKEEESSQIIIKKEIGFGDHVIELFGLQNVPADTSAPKVPVCQNDQESSQIIIKEEIDCDVDAGSVNRLDLLQLGDEVPGPILRRSTRRRCPRFSLEDLSESSGDEGAEVCAGHLRDSGRSTRKRRDGNGHSAYGKTSDHLCSVCGRRFSTLGNLKRHVAAHFGSEVHTCGRCGKSFARSGNLKQHERLHRGEKFRCGVCRREFSQPGHLTQHARLHTGERPFGCADCGKRFRTRGSLQDHVRIHTGERPYACRFCSKSFTQAAHLRVHTRLHTGERRHACDVCGRRFVRRTHLKLHACMHSGRRRRRKV